MTLIFPGLTRTVYLPSNSSIPNQMGDQENIWTTVRITPILSNYPQVKDLHSAITRELLGETPSRRTKNGGNWQSFYLSRFPITQSPNWCLAQQHFERPNNILFEWKPWLLCMVTWRHDGNQSRSSCTPPASQSKSFANQQKRRKFATEWNRIINEEI